MSDERRAILNRVARGELSPEQAAADLAELDRLDREGLTSEGSPGPAAGPVEPPPARASRICLHVQAGSAVVIGDPTVREAVARGPHSARYEGSTLRIETDLEQSWAFESPWFGYIPGRARRHLDPGARARHPMLEIRVNPELPLELRTNAGRTQVRGVRGPITAEINAGSTSIDGFNAPFDVNVSAGALSMSGHLASGASRLRCSAGSAKVLFDATSSVRIAARVTMGKVKIGTEDGWYFDEGTRSVIIGGGAGTLDIDASLGSVRIDTATPSGRPA